MSTEQHVFTEQINLVNRLRRALGFRYEVWMVRGPIPKKFAPLETYLHEKVSQGIEHTPAWKEEMAALRAEFVEWREEDYWFWRDLNSPVNRVREATS